MKISSLVIVFVIMAFVLTGMGSFYSELFSNYNTPDYENISIQANATNIAGDIINIGQRFQEPKGFLENVGMVIEGGWSAITTVLNFPSIMINTVAQIAGGVSFIPNWLAPLISFIVWAVFVFAIFKVIFKVEI
jgi:hypothetical protein